MGRNPPPPFPQGKFFDIGSIHFRQFPATLVFVAEKPIDPAPQPPPLKMRDHFFYIGSIHFRQFPATLFFVAEKPPPPPMREKFLTSDLSISGNFEQLWFLWQKSPPPRMRENFWHQIYSFQAISSNSSFCGRNAPPPSTQDEGNFFNTRSIHFRQFQATLVFVAKSPPPPPPMTSTTQGLPPVMKDYLPGTITHLVT